VQPREERPARRPRFGQSSEQDEQGRMGAVARDEPTPDAPLTLDLAVLPPAIAPLADPVFDADVEAAPAPKKRGRPRKAVAEAEAE